MLNPSSLRQYFPQDEAGHDLIGLGFYFSFYFSDGHQRAKRQAVAAVCTDYWRHCGDQMKWMIQPPKSKWQRVPADYEFDQWSRAWPDEDWAWSMIFHSGRVREEAANFEMLGIGDSTQTFNRSSLVLVVPVDWFLHHPSQHPVSLYQRWAEMLQARHGSAGLGLIPAEDTPRRSRTSGIAAGFRKQFPGIELVDIIGNQNVFWGLLSANWLNLLDADFVQQLGGAEALRAALKTEVLGAEIGFHPYAGGLILSAGEAPRLSEEGQAQRPPLVYGPVARLLKPLRTREPGACWGCPKDESLEWLARHD